MLIWVALLSRRHLNDSSKNFNQSKIFLSEYPSACFFVYFPLLSLQLCESNPQTFVWSSGVLLVWMVVAKWSWCHGDAVQRCVLGCHVSFRLRPGSDAEPQSCLLLLIYIDPNADTLTLFITSTQTFTGVLMLTCVATDKNVLSFTSHVCCGTAEH